MNYNRSDLPQDGDTKAGGLVAAAQFAPVARDPYAVAGGYGGPTADSPSDLQLNILEYLRIAIKRRWLILSVVASFIVLAILITLMRTPFYTSTVRLQIDRDVMKVVEGGNVTPVEGQDFEFMKTQYELLQGRTLAERVASALKLGENPDFLKPTSFSIVGFVKELIGFGSSTNMRAASKSDLNSAAAQIILANRVIRPISGSRLVDIGYSDPDPSRAQKIAAALADAFIASNLDKRFEANSYAKVFLQDQLQLLKVRLEQSEKALLDFGQKEEIVQTSDKESIAETNLASANAALGTLIAERMKNEELWKQIVSAKAIDVPQLLNNPVIEGLQTKRNSLQSEYQEKLETFQPSYPVMVQLSNQISEIDRQLAAEVNTLKSSYKAAYDASVEQETEMKGQIERLKQDVLDLQKRSIQYNILKREADTNRSLYDGLLQRYKEVDIAGGVGANNVFIVDKATLPEHPSSPRILQALLIALGLGLATAAGAALLLERLDDTLRTPEEIERALGYSTLGIIPKIGLGTTLEAELENPRSHTSEAYRSLCTALQLSTEKGLPKTLLVTIPRLPGNPKTPLAKRRNSDSTERMIRPKFLDRESRQDLIELARNGSAAHRLARRANALVLLDDGMSCEAIAKVLLLDDDTIRTWYRLYEEDGIEGLTNFGYEGSACQLNGEQQEKLKAWVATALPRTTRQVGAWIENEFGIVYEGRSGLIALLHRLGLEYHKPNVIPRKLDEEKQKAFIESYEKLLNSLGDDEAVLFADAVHPTHAARPVGCWAPSQDKLAIEQTSGRQRINIHGAIDLETGQTRMIEALTIDAASTIRLLQSIEAFYPMLAFIHVFLDNARYHHAKLVQEWLALPGRRIKLHFIPTYCPHLNPIERLWGVMHRNVTHNKCYATCAQFADATLGFLRETVPRNWADLCDSVTDNFRIINPKEFRVVT